MKEQFQLEEYRRLTDEIENNAKRIFQIISVVLTFSIGIISLAFNKDVHFLFPLAIHLILLSALQLLSTQLHSTFRIATYISRVYESDQTGISWESDMINYRKLEGKKSRYSLSIFTLFVIQAVISHAVSTWILYQQESQSTLENILLVSIGLVAAYGYFRSNKFIKKAMDTKGHLAQWEEVL